jgi:hypothetical protein
VSVESDSDPDSHYILPQITVAAAEARLALKQSTLNDNGYRNHYRFLFQQTLLIVKVL